MMAKRSLELDANDDTLGDYSVIVRDIPLDMSKDQLKTSIEDKHSSFKVKVAYINYIYNIEELVECDQEEIKLRTYNSLYKVNIKKQCMQKNITLD